MIRLSALAFAAAAIFVSAGQAMPVVEQEGGTAKVTPKAAPVTSGGFDWTYVEVGAGVAGGIVLAGGALLVSGRRTRNAEPVRV